MTYDEMEKAISDLFNAATAIREANLSGLLETATPETARQLRTAMGILGLMVDDFCTDGKDNIFYVEGMLDKFDGETIGRIMANLPITSSTLNGELNKHLAVEVADVLGEYLADDWYRFTALVQKLV